MSFQARPPTHLSRLDIPLLPGIGLINVADGPRPVLIKPNSDQAQSRSAELATTPSCWVQVSHQRPGARLRFICLPARAPYRGLEPVHPFASGYRAPPLPSRSSDRHNPARPGVSRRRRGTGWDSTGAAGRARVPGRDAAHAAWRLHPGRDVPSKKITQGKSVAGAASHEVICPKCHVSRYSGSTLWG